MKPRLSYRGLLLILLVLAGTNAAGQDNATTRFIDSITKSPQLQDTAVIETAWDSTLYTKEESDTSAYETENLVPVDTAITSVLKKISADSLATIKKDRGFYYQAWLDSLLRAEEAKLKLVQDSPRLPDLSFLGTLFTIFKIVLWVLAAAMLFFVVFKLFLGKGALFLNTRKNIDTVIDIQEEELSTARYEGLIKQAEAENNYRLAVRYLYLQALYNLSAKGYVRLGVEKTNHQYTAALRQSKPGFARAFADLTHKYEYIWYGEYLVTAPMYQSLRAAFTAFNNEIA